MSSADSSRVRNSLALRLACASVCALHLAGCKSTPGVDPRPLPTIRENAEFACMIGDYAKAEQDWQIIADRTPEDNQARFMLGKSQLGGGKPAEAARNFAAALDVEPLRDDILDNYAEALYQANDRDELMQQLSRACSERGRVKDYLRMAKYAQAIGNPDDARQALSAAAKLDGGKSWEVQLGMAKVFHEQKNRPEAVRRLRMAYFLNPENKEVNAMVRELGEIPGPSFALVPEELVMPVAAPQKVGTQPTGATYRRPQAAAGEK